MYTKKIAKIISEHEVHRLAITNALPHILQNNENDKAKREQALKTFEMLEASINSSISKLKSKIKVAMLIAQAIEEHPEPKIWGRVLIANWQHLAIDDELIITTKKLETTRKERKQFLPFIDQQLTEMLHPLTDRELAEAIAEFAAINETLEELKDHALDADATKVREFLAA